MNKTERACKCAHCKKDVIAVLHRQIFHNGTVAFTWVCNNCDRKNPGSGTLYLSKEIISEKLSPEEIDALPLLMPDLSCRCAVCGARDVELHHWMPRALSAEADKWPKDYLCKFHHDEWHSIVTPELTGTPEGGLDGQG